MEEDNNYEEDKNYLGIDWGKSKVGLALGHESTKMAMPFKVVKNLAEVLEVIKQEEITHVILGHPIHMSGDKGVLVEFEQFHQSLLALGYVQVDLVDERLTTKQAGGLMVHKKQTAEEDAIAAMLILQSYFDQY